MHKRLTGEQESMKNVVPEFNTSKMQLVFSEKESIFKQIQQDEDIRDDAGAGQERRMVVRMGTDNEVYKNYALGKTIELRELGPRKYIMEDSLRVQQWKLDETETKTIKGGGNECSTEKYHCMVHRSNCLS